MLLLKKNINGRKGQVSYLKLDFFQRDYPLLVGYLL